MTFWAFLHALEEEIIRRLGDDGFRTCPECDGTGVWTYKYSALDSPFVQIEGMRRTGTKCKPCDGQGEFYIPTHQEKG